MWNSLRGFEVPNHVFLLCQPVYGLKQTPLNFYKHLILEDIKFVKSAYDNCLFTNDSIMILFWVDNCIFYAKDDSQINQIIDSLKDSFLLE